MSVRYLSEEWKRQEWQTFEEMHIAGDTSDCGGWGPDGPCGGCARCMAQQFGYYMMKEEERARVFLRAGFDVANPTLVTLDYFPGFGGYHTSYDCRMKEERQEWTFPWEVPFS